MKNFRRMFREAGRLEPSPELWRRIESRTAARLSVLHRGSRAGRGLPAFRLAASLALAAGLATLGLSLQHRSKFEGPLGANASSQAMDASPGRASQAVEVVDPDLMVWDADLGELDSDADDPAEEVL